MANRYVFSSHFCNAKVTSIVVVFESDTKNRRLKEIKEGKYVKICEGFAF